MSHDSVIQVTGLQKEYDLGYERLLILDGIDLKVQQNEMLIVSGPSGSGKTTFLSLLAGLDSDFSGSILLGDIELNKLSLSKRTALRVSQIGMVFQDYRLLPQLTALENVEAPLYLQSLSKSERKERALNALQLVELEVRKMHKPHQMSGGEKQRVGIARAVAGGANLLLCDEPTGNLNSEMSAKIFSLLRMLSDQYGKTIVLTTHDQNAQKYADRVVHLRDGVFQEVA